jgi:Na+:H+ antiporter, NhaA family
VLGGRVPDSLKVFLLSLAVVDDIGAIVVIAAFYTSVLALGWLAVAGGTLMLIAALRRMYVSHPAVYLLLGTAVWFATHESGVHPTIAGVALGLLTPVGPLSERLEEALHPWTSFLVIPVFALANAGVNLADASPGDVLESPIGLGILLGLVVGKIVGISISSWLVVRFGLARLPAGVRWPQLAGVSALAGIGFTVSLFVAGLAFPDEARQSVAKLAVLSASTLAAMLGSTMLAFTCRRSSGEACASDTVTGS